MLEQLLPGDPVVLLDLQAPYYEILRLLQDLFIVGEPERLVVDPAQKTLDVPAGPGGLPEKHLVEHQSNTSDVTLCSVRLVPEQLRTHVKRGPHELLHLLTAPNVYLRGEPEICNLKDVLMDHCILWFDVTVHVPLQNELAEALE